MSFWTEGGFIHDDEVVFFVPGEVDIVVSPADGSTPYHARAQLNEWSGTIDGKPVVTIPFEEGGL